MAHITPKAGYADLADRLNRFPQGAPDSALLFRILEMLFSSREAEFNPSRIGNRFFRRPKCAGRSHQIRDPNLQPSQAR